ncbi:DUF2780 domain-containing protein [Alcanivorax jadensis]|uniref:DUF2780 domain-containing protein n=1 Tax=Alcanivorax jadensis TaxID=64988 RepID=UPI002409D6B4|nr:DUF2780 domain-containing protein [Alcanivorax jadensis]MDF1638840.1 DUF2780 domain-containing protein [Alcanivorax jadensis]
MNTFRIGVLGVSFCLVLASPAQAFDLKKMTDSTNAAVDKASESADAGINKASETANDGINKAGDSANSTLDSVNGGMAVSGEAKALVDSLSTDLDVSGQQAAGGAGALLAMAQSNLSGDQFSGVLNKVPGLESLLGGGEGGGVASSMLGNISSMQGVTKAFGALGMSPEMVSQFAPKILGFLGDKGVTGQVLNSLKGLWGV